jgi:hypothetical protein
VIARAQKMAQAPAGAPLGEAALAELFKAIKYA